MSHLACSTVSWMQLAAALSGGSAALLWLRASLVRMPSTAFNEMPMNNMGQISRAYWRQSRWNAAAAIFTAIAAILQAFLVYAPTCINFGAG